MNNPFLKRATEFYRDEEAFLAIVSPEPIKFFLSQVKDATSLYDRLVIIRGTPGSGKTTLARVFEYPAVSTAMQNAAANSAYRSLQLVLSDRGAARDGHPTLLGYRLPLETDYRDLWEFDYPHDLKLGLLTTMIQARTVLGWARNLRTAGVNLENASIIPRPDAGAATDAIGGITVKGIVERARAIEAALYNIVSALLPPKLKELDEDTTSAYRPFDVIDKFRIEPEPNSEQTALELQPLVILDDAHTLHPLQFNYLQHWLTRRELRVARWVLTRLDVLTPDKALAIISEDTSERSTLPGITKGREIIEILLQTRTSGRSNQRKAFRKMAKDMANRYLHQMDIFSQRHLDNLADLLRTDCKPISPSKLDDLCQKVKAKRDRIQMSDTRFQELEQLVEKYRPDGNSLPHDENRMMLLILMQRYMKRTPTRNLFDSEEDIDPSKPLKADAPLREAARLLLHHWYEKPYYYGIDDLCDASSENAEQFLHLAADLVETSATQLVRTQGAPIKPRTQDRALSRKAHSITSDWNFPQFPLVKTLTNAMAEKCLARSLELNAPLGAGANAFGIPQSDFDELVKIDRELARVLQFAFAYNALSPVPHYACKGKKWCLLELGGTVLLRHGLTLKRGGFIESSVSELSRIVKGTTS